MKKITKIQLLAVELQHCRSYVETERLLLFDRTSITGANGAGKTTIAHAVAYVLYGVNYYGQQDIGFLRSEESRAMKVQVGFRDQDGETHFLARTRNGDTTTLTYDSYTIRQADIDAMICDKSLFLSMFNPLYLASLPDKTARELVLKCLPPVLPEQVLEEMSEAYRVHLDGIALTNPDEQLASCRTEQKRLEEAQQRLRGQLEEARNQLEHAGEHLAQQKQELAELRKKRDTLKTRKYEDINKSALEMKSMELEQKIVDNNSRQRSLETKLEEAKKRTYQSQYITALAEVSAQLAGARQEYKDAKEHYERIEPGFVCPTCKRGVDEAELPAVKEIFDGLLQGIRTVGTELVEKRKEIETLQKKEREIFEQYKAADIEKYSEELRELQKQVISIPGRPSFSDQLAEIEEQLEYGNLSEQDCIDLSSYEADIASLEGSIKDTENQGSKQRVLELINRQTELEDEYTKLRNQLSALQEYLTVRARLAIQPLKMPHTAVQLYDVTLSGVVKNVFCFEYLGRSYSYLSSSEKIRAGIEIAAMMRNVTGLDIPLFIDEAQSLHEISGAGVCDLSAFKDVSLPSQLMVCYCTQNRQLAVTRMDEADQQLPMAS